MLNNLKINYESLFLNKTFSIFAIVEKANIQTSSKSVQL